MLIEFNVANFLSIKEKATLSMVASNDSSLPHNTFSPKAFHPKKLLTSAVLYGANASGKSNFLKAITFMKFLTINSFREQSIIKNLPSFQFKLDERYSKTASSFEMAFICNDIKFLYGFSVNASYVEEEWLYSYPKKQPRLLFLRKHDKTTGKAIIQYGTHWGGPKKSLSDITPPSALLLSVASHAKYDLADSLVSWFSEYITRAESLPDELNEQEFTKHWAFQDKKVKEKMLGFLQQADIDIVEFTIEKIPLKRSKRFADLPEPVKSAILGDLDAEFGDGKEPHVHEVKFIHKGLNKKGKSIQIALELGEESDGTKKLFSLAGPVLFVLSKGYCLIVDELDVKLHPLLTRSLVELFHNPKVNKKGAQLIFATHDSNLLDIKHLFRRDQIWFTSRIEDGASELYSLLDYKNTPRKGENIRGGYLAGRYGAIPLITHLLD